MEPTGTNGRTRHTLSDPLVGRVSSCGGFLVGWQGTLFLVVTTTMLVRRLICSRPLSGSRTATTGIVVGSVAGRRFFRSAVSYWFCGGHGPGETPGPFPNPEAKAWHGDGTAPDRVWESSTPPHHTYRKPLGAHAPRGFPHIRNRPRPEPARAPGPPRIPMRPTPGTIPGQPRRRGRTTRRVRDRGSPTPGPPGPPRGRLPLKEGSQKPLGPRRDTPAGAQCVLGGNPLNTR